MLVLRDYMGPVERTNFIRHAIPEGKSGASGKDNSISPVQSGGSNRKLTGEVKGSPGKLIVTL